MHIKEAPCGQCGTVVIVDGLLFDVGTVRVRCPGCGAYFLPPGSSRSVTIREATNASVDIEIWEPEAAS